MIDVGCGVGLYTQELARRGAIAVGVDLDTDVLRRAKAGTSHAHFIRADASRLPFRCGAFGMAVSVEVMSHLDPEPRRQMADEIHRVLAPGGNLFCTMHNQVRLVLGRWLRLRRACQVYRTSHLDVWPSVPATAAALARDVGLAVVAPVRYLNYHSRFTYEFYVNHPWVARLLITLEDLLSAMPGIRRLAITFLIVAVKPPKIIAAEVGADG